MNIFKMQANPVGEAVQDEDLGNFIKIMSAEWNESKDRIPWYKFWKRTSLVRVTKFLTKALDDLIAYVDNYIDTKGEDKKATVLATIATLYDYVAHEAMPIFLRPFSPVIKNYILFGVISPMIDWIVEKYRHGNWRKEDAEVIKAQWAQKVSLL